MLGVRIVIQSLRQVFGNLGGTLRVIAPIVSAQFVGFYALAYALNNASFTVGRNGLPPWLVVVSTLLVAIPAVWMAVAWHRLILLGERPRSIFPPFHAGRLSAYFFYSVLLVLAFLLLAPVLGRLGGFLIHLRKPQELWTAILFASALIYLPLGLIMLRLSPILPATAIGATFGLRDAWSKTRGANLAIITIVVLAILSIKLINLGPMRLLPAAPLHFAFQLMFGWFCWIVVLSIITTIYGHFLEGRALNA